MSKAFNLKQGHARVTVGALVAVKVAILFILALNRRIVMDEFEQLGWAKYLGHGFYTTIWPAKAVGYAIFLDLPHLIGWNARSMLLLGRMEMALLACGTLAILYASARSIGESKTRAALIVVIVLSFSNFIERIFETRGDPLSVFFAGAALLVAIRGRDREWWIFAAGLLSGLAFLSTQKAVYFNFALGIALFGDAALDRRYVEGIACGASLVAGWFVAIIFYCLFWGGGHSLAVAHNLFFGPVGVASSQIAAEYGGLRNFVEQTLVRNALLYIFCFAGMVLALLRIQGLGGERRIALIFSVIITALIFAHNQPWPYVFVMALPFLALWAPESFEALARRPLYRLAGWAVLAVAIAGSFARNLQVLQIDNHAQLALVDRAERLVGPKDIYFDGIGMLPNRREPSTLWLDQTTILETLREGKASEAYWIFANAPPKLIIWTYRMDAIDPVVAPLIRNSYVPIAPNIRIAGSLLRLGERVHFNVPIVGTYKLYGLKGEPLRAGLAINGGSVESQLTLPKGSVTITLRSGPAEAILLPKGDYVGRIKTGQDDKGLFANVYN